MRLPLTTLLFLLPFVAMAQDIAQEVAPGDDTLNSEKGLSGTSPDELLETRSGGHGKHKVLTTGDHPIEDNLPDFTKSEPRPDGSVCIEKTSFVEKMERQQIKECWHQNITACHFSSVTEFTSMQQKRCEENTFVKTCKINFKEVALNHTVRTCHKPLVQQCSYRHHNQRPVTVCRTWFETTCNTTLVVDAYGQQKGGQQAGCEKIPKKICAPDHCAMVEGPEECIDKNIFSTMMKPEEVCDLQPTTDCQIVTNLIPHLRQREICETVPKEFCHTKLDSPKMVRKPVTIKWCTFPNSHPNPPSHPPPSSNPSSHLPSHYQPSPTSSNPSSHPPSNPISQPPSYQQPYQPSYEQKQPTFRAANGEPEGIEDMRLPGLELLRKNPALETQQETLPENEGQSAFELLNRAL